MSARPHTLCSVCRCVTWRVDVGLCRSCTAMRRTEGERPPRPLYRTWVESRDPNVAPRVQEGRAR